MKIPMTAEEWAELKEINVTGREIYLMNLYLKSQLKHHLEHFAEECKGTTTEIFINGFDYNVLLKDIDQTLNDYLTKNGIV